MTFYRGTGIFFKKAVKTFVKTREFCYNISAHSVLTKGESMEEKNVLIQDEMSDKIIKAAEEIATASGEVTVRKILRKLGITNRVFYNRFHNIDEVLEIVYVNTAVKVRESMATEYDGKQDFFEYVIDAVADTLIASYDIKMKFNQHVFEYDSVSQNNYDWYMDRIKKLFSYAQAQGLIQEIDAEALSYAIWCFCRGYNADAVMRMPKEDAVKNLKYALRFLLEGLKK